MKYFAVPFSIPLLYVHSLLKSKYYLLFHYVVVFQIVGLLFLLFVPQLLKKNQ